MIIVFFTTFNVYQSSEPAQQAKQFLNKEENEWLKALKKPLKVGITHIPNQVIYKKGSQAIGFSIDFFHEIEKILSIKFDYVYFETWNELISAAKSHKIDIVFLAQKTESRLQYFHFTDSILAQQNKIIVQSNNHTVSNTESLNNHKVAVVYNSAIYDYLDYNYPEIILVPTETELEALKFVSNNMVDAAISESVRASYYIEAYNIDNLRVAENLSYDYNLRIASRNDLPVLSVILSKVVENISADTKQALLLKWGYVKDKERYFDKETLIYLGIIFGIIFPFSLYVYFINLNLAKEIAQRKSIQEKLSQLNTSLENRVKKEVEKNKKQQLLMLQQSRLAQMGEVINMIAHQWRQPLNHLSLINQTLYHQYTKQKLTDENVEHFRKKSNDTIQQMSSTIDDFRNFFKPEKKKVNFCINDAIRHALEVSAPMLKDNSIEVIFHEKEPYYVYGFSNELAQSILNILYNAQDTLLGKETEDKHIDIFLVQEEKYTLLSIQDNAGGIPEEIIEHIFDPYFSTKGEKQGTGLGLYISKIIVEEHMNGKLTVLNKEKGACFNISLPSLKTEGK